MSRIITGKVRLSYTHIWEPRPLTEEEIAIGAKPKYSAQLIIPKSDKKTIDAINKAVEEAIEAGRPKLENAKTKKINKANLKLPLRDGDEDEKTEGDPVYENCYFLNANSMRQPGVVDKKVQKIIDQDEIYSGCYARCSLTFFAFDGKSKGIAVGLDNIQKLSDGEKLAGGVSAEEDFDEIKDDEDDSEEL